MQAAQWFSSHAVVHALQAAGPVAAATPPAARLPPRLTLTAASTLSSPYENAATSSAA
jgi:hypothetical protein